MKQWHKIFFVGLFCFSHSAISHAEDQEDFDTVPDFCFDEDFDCCNKLTYSPLRINIAGLVGDEYGEDNENGTLELFYAPTLSCDDWQPFIDLKGHHLGSSNSWAFNAGIGARWLSSCDRTYGTNIFYDYRKYKNTHFNQIGLGVESLGEIVDFRINGYIPFKRNSHNGILFDDYIGDYFVEATRYTSPMAGIDAQVGFTLFNNCEYRLYGAIGSYYYRTIHNPSEISSKSTFGGMAKIDLQWTQYLNLGVNVSYDHLFKTQFQGLLQLTLPFDACFNICNWNSNTCADIFLKPVGRHEVITLNRSGLVWVGNY